MLTISAGHFGKGTGAVGFLDEGSEVIYLVQALQKRLQHVNVQTIIDTVSKNQQQNLRYLVNAHNRTVRVLDVSIHFNAVNEIRKAGIGTEVLYVNPDLRVFAAQMSRAIAQAGNLIDRGAKQRSNLAFLNKTTKPAIIIEICFVNSKTDVQRYEQHKDNLIEAIAQTLESYVRKTNEKKS